MKCNWRRWLWGLIPIVILSWVAAQAERGRIEHDLSERAKVALVQSGFGWAEIGFRGRDAVLSGRALEDNEPGGARDALRTVWGVRDVDNKADLLPKVDPYIWAASRRNNRIRLFFHVPNRATRNVILGMTKATFPGFEIVDRMSVARGVPPMDAWLAGVSFALKQLAALKRGDVRLDALELAVGGEAEDVATYLAIKTALLNGVPKGVRIGGDNVKAPTASPYKWSAQFSAGKLVLAGHVPSEAARAELLAAVNAGSPGMPVVDQMQPAEGAPQGWAAATAASVRQLMRLENGSAELKDSALLVAGQSGDEAAAEAVRAALRAAMPATIKLTDQIRAREARRPPSEPAPGPDERRGEITSHWNAHVAPAPAAPPDDKAVAQAKACQDTLVNLGQAGQILFESASAELNGASFATLDKLADAVRTCPNMIVRIEGHTDREGTPDSNQQLSLRRAENVRSYLVRSGVDESLLEPVGHGERRPAAPNDSSDNMAKNRRIEFVVRPR